MLKGAGLTLHKREIIYDRIKANFVVEHPNKGGKRHIIEIIEDEISHYKVPIEGLGHEIKMRQRGRLADKLALELGYTGYSCISYVELEYAVDESEPFNTVITRSFEQGSDV